MSGSRDHWPELARRWAAIGTPLRPVPEDLDAYRTALGSPRDVVLLGVTPELARLAEAQGGTVTAVDRSREMLDFVWPQDLRRSRAIEGDWRQMPVPSGSIDAILGDGALSFFRWPDDYEPAARELHRVLRPGGRLIVRLYARLNPESPLDQVRTDLDAGRIRSVHAFKWRVGMALGVNTDVSEMNEVWQRFGGESLFERHGWPIEGLPTITAWKGSRFAYSFPTLDQVTEAFDPLLERISVHHGTYELAERCPIVTFRRR